MTMSLKLDLAAVMEAVAANVIVMIMVINKIIVGIQDLPECPDLQKVIMF